MVEPQFKIHVLMTSFYLVSSELFYTVYNFDVLILTKTTTKNPSSVQYIYFCHVANCVVSNIYTMCAHLKITFRGIIYCIRYASLIAMQNKMLNRQIT